MTNKDAWCNDEMLATYVTILYITLKKHKFRYINYLIYGIIDTCFSYIYEILWFTAWIVSALFSRPYVEDLFSRPYVEDLFSRPYVEDLFSRPYVEDLVKRNNQTASPKQISHILECIYIVILAHQSNRVIRETFLRWPINPRRGYRLTIYKWYFTRMEWTRKVNDILCTTRYI